MDNTDAVSFRIGCAVWAYKDWVGDFFPSGSPTSDFLRLYSQRFTTVEGNTTFYSVPSAANVQRWMQETPADFRFCPKLPRQITHDGLLMSHWPEAIAFLERMQGLGTRLGPILVQLPPSYSPNQGEDLAAFLAQWPHDQAAIAVEVRHLDWFSTEATARLNTLLAQWQAGRVLLDTRPIYDVLDEGHEDPQLASERRKPKVPLQPVVTAPFSLVRYISHPSLSVNQPYINDWVEQISAWLTQGTQIYFFVHCPIEAHSPGIARHIQQCLEGAGVAVPPLPWDTLETPTQLSLFG